MSPAETSAQVEVRTTGGAQHKPAVLVIACAVALMTVLDVSVVTVALPAIRDDLGLSTTGLQWVLNAYSLTFAGFLLLGGRAADLLGRKRVFLCGLVVFTASSLVGGLAQESWQLIAARAVQGLGSAILAPVTLSLLTTTFPEPDERARALGVWAGVAGLGGALGGVVGGVLTGLLNWRWVLIVNVPIGVVLVAASVWALTGTPRRPVRGQLDLPGSLTVTLGTAGLVAGIIAAEESGWTSARTVGLLAAAATCLVLFVLIERRAVVPIVPLSLFRIRPLALADGISLLTGGVLPATFYFLSLHLQEVQGMTALTAGLALLPPAVGITLGAQLAPRLMRRFAHRTVYVIGVGLTVGGLAWLSRLDADGSYTVQILVPSFLAMAGFGISGLPVTVAAMSDVGDERTGVASALLNASRQIGGAVLLAVLVSVASAVTAGADGAPPDAVTHGFGVALLVGAGMVAVAGVLGLGLPQRARPVPLVGQP
ncbi:MFS transporter [Blastococcus tunisiensis]|uniref:Drug resistance transporter, EmrB/QacA subfamily n=1 Tax=Blastococcus tunisiensis TaxID=1798228 RepID=A0A1I2M7U5_9ACTN|nr:MFS transporter [Blastococcus sp. DSM 46838]SFF87542.1 drug resistance transporter, EmrB/QacA subfamily [Blastococcus sp. DSM 46838]